VARLKHDRNQQQSSITQLEFQAILPISSPQAVNQRENRPFLRWAGSKRSIVNSLKDLSPKKYTKYVEPFVGAGSLFFRLKPRHAVLSDINPHLVNAYQSVKDDPDAVFQELSLWSPDGGDYYAVRESYELELSVKSAAQFIYLNRFCYNGIYRTNADGKFNVPKGSRTGSLLNLSTLKQIAADLAHVTIVAGDFALVLASHVKEGDFVYLDPPYPRLRSSGEYGISALKPAEFQRVNDIMEFLDRNGVQFLLSYPLKDLPTDLPLTWNVKCIEVKRSISKSKSIVTEAVVSNY
jgi:DNA adenine methylase